MNPNLHGLKRTEYFKILTLYAKYGCANVSRCKYCVFNEVHLIDNRSRNVCGFTDGRANGEPNESVIVRKEAKKRIKEMISGTK